MRDLKLILVLALLLSTAAYPQSSNLQIAITIDDLPLSFGNDVSEEMQDSIPVKIIKSLEKYDVTAVGSIIGSFIDSNNVKYIEQFIEAGHQIGSHTFSHYDFNRTSAKKYIEDIKRADSIITEFIPEFECNEGDKLVDMGEYDAVKTCSNEYFVYPDFNEDSAEKKAELIKSEKVPGKYKTLELDKKYIRYPFLHYGETHSKKDSVQNFLEKAGYRIAYSSINSGDWSYQKRCVEAFKKGDWDKIEKIGRKYVKNVAQETESSLEYTYQRAGRNIKHIVIMHMNLLNALFLDDVLQYYKDNGWEFITLQEALEDEIYSWNDFYAGEIGFPLPFHVNRPKPFPTKKDSVFSN